MNNVRFALRQTANHPGFSIILVLMLAIGIGATTAMFSLFYDVLMRPLPVHEPEGLVNLMSPGPKPVGYSTGIAGRVDSVFSYPMFRDLEANQEVFTGLAAHRTFDVNLSTGVQTHSLRGLLVSGQYFHVLALQPTIGRLIDGRDEPGTGESRVAVLSHAFWQTRLGGDPDIVGRALTINGHSLTVIGVAPEGFTGTSIGVEPAVYVPLTLAWVLRAGASNDENFRGYHWLHLFARLRDGVSLTQAQASISALQSSIIRDVEAGLWDLSDETLERFLNRPMRLEPGAMGQSARRSNMRQPLTILLSLTGLVLLIVCANITGLLLARNASRDGEIAVRISVGASRWQLLRQLFCETAIIAAIGGLASVPVAALILQGAGALLPPNRSGFVADGIDTATLVIAATIAILTTLLVGIVPALRRSQPNMALAAKGAVARMSKGQGKRGFWQSLITAQLSLAIVLVVLAALFVRSLANVFSVDLGMDIDSVSTFSISPGLNGYSPEQSADLYRRLTEELAAEPGVLNVSSALVPLLSSSNFMRPISIDGNESQDGVDVGASFNIVSPEFFRTFSIPVHRGREFAAGDGGNASQVAIVNESFVAKFGLGDDVLGKRFTLLSGQTAADPNIEIVGVVADAKYSEVKDDIPAQFYLPLNEESALGSMTFYVRSGIDPVTMLQSVPGVVARVDPDIPVEDLQTLATRFRENVFIDRTITILSGAFSVLATCLAAVGLYGVLAYSMSRRTKELGLRLALGSTPRGLRNLILSQVGIIVLIASCIGIAGSIGIGRLAESMLFGLTGFSPPIMIGAVALLGAVALGAGYLPAHRVMRTDPMQALRED